MRALREYFIEGNYECCQIILPYAFTIILREDNSEFEIVYCDDTNHLEDMVLEIRTGRQEIKRRILRREVDLIDIPESVVERILNSDDEIFEANKYKHLFTQGSRGKP
jgi:hypothetical protein